MSTKKKATVVKAQSNSNLMYLGPTITGVVRHSTTFKDGILPDKVKECVEQFPVMKKLFVSMADIPKATIELRKEQSALGTIYSQVANKFKK